MPTSRGRGNFIAEWFGHRVYPSVNGAPPALSDQRAGRCPFLSAATGEDRVCIKSANSAGVCTISSNSNGPRQDWLVCPYRALDDSMIEDVVERLFGTTSGAHSPFAVTALAKPPIRADFEARIAKHGSAIVFFQDKLGGEISLAATDRSPEVSFDVTMVEITREAEQFSLGRYGLFEIQTMDFHGTYKNAVANLTAALRLHRNEFPAEVERHPEWLSEKVEGPNIANVFKRTFYQMMLKFNLGAHENCAGCALAIPRSVWDSWQRHLGRPELVEEADGDWRLSSDPSVSAPRKSWIYVFDVDAANPATPSPLVSWRVIHTTPESLSHFALEVAPAAAVEGGADVDRLLTSIHARLSAVLPALAPLTP